MPKKGGLGQFVDLREDIERSLSMSTKISNALSGLQTTSPRTRLNVFHEIFVDLSGFR